MALTSPEHRPRQRRGAGGARHGEINVTPFVDVMLVLLIVFMITAPLLTVGVTVDLPETTSAPLPGQDEPLSVSVEPGRPGLPAGQRRCASTSSARGCRRSPSASPTRGSSCAATR